MDWKSGGPYWAVKSGLIYAFPHLDTDQGCDVALMGAGITGAQIESRPHPLTGLFSFARLECP